MTDVIPLAISKWDGSDTKELLGKLLPEAKFEETIETEAGTHETMETLFQEMAEAQHESLNQAGLAQEEVHKSEINE